MAMHLGKQTGNVFNHLMSRDIFREPVVGEGATVLMWSDRHAATVIEWDAKRQIVSVQEDKATLVGGHPQTDQQEYSYAANPKAEIQQFKWKDGWRQLERQGDKMKLTKKGTGRGLLVGHRDEYYDHTF